MLNMSAARCSPALAALREHTGFDSLLSRLSASNVSTTAKLVTERGGGLGDKLFLFLLGSPSRLLASPLLALPDHHHLRATW